MKRRSFLKAIFAACVAPLALVRKRRIRTTTNYVFEGLSPQGPTLGQDKWLCGMPGALVFDGLLVFTENHGVVVIKADGKIEEVRA